MKLWCVWGRVWTLYTHTGLYSGSTSVWIHSQLDGMYKQNSEPPAVQPPPGPSKTEMIMSEVIIVKLDKQWRFRSLEFRWGLTPYAHEGQKQIT